MRTQADVKYALYYSGGIDSSLIDTFHNFNYKLTYEGQQYISVNKSDVYHCKKILATRLIPSDGNDYAVIELNRNVQKIKPLKIRRKGKLKRNTKLLVIGYPSGLPVKIAGGAVVQDLEKKYFVANLDTYGGNSGSSNQKGNQTLTETLKTTIWLRLNGRSVSSRSIPPKS